MKPHELTPSLQNYLVGWRLEATKAQRIAAQYKSMSLDVDKERFGDTYGQQGRQYIQQAEILTKRVQAAEQGFVFCTRDDLAFEQEYPELTNVAKALKRFVYEWPMVDPDGRDLLQEAARGGNIAPGSPTLEGFQPDLKTIY